GVPGADQVEHLPLAPGQPGRMRTGRGPRPGRDGPDAEPAHLLPGDPGGGRGAQTVEDLQGLAQRNLLVRVVQNQGRLVETAGRLGELVLGSGEADLESFDFTEPAFAFGFSDPGGQLVADLDEAVGPERGRADAGVIMDARGSSAARTRPSGRGRCPTGPSGG